MELRVRAHEQTNHDRGCQQEETDADCRGVYGRQRLSVALEFTGFLGSPGQRFCQAQ